jgi:multidrug efflux system membrane fusion protein
VSVRGEFANPDVLLLPGMYVRVQTQQGVDANAILVPQRAVTRSTDGKPQVMLVGKDDVVESRAVQTGAMRGSDWHIVDGLAAGDRVIVGGVSAAVPGQKVSVAPAEQARVAASGEAPARATN